MAAKQQSLQESRAGVHAFAPGRCRARAAFEEKGYVNTTIDDITAGAGASRATFLPLLPQQGRSL